MDLSFARAASVVSRLALCLLFALSFTSCEQAEQESQAPVSGQQGLAQARVNEEGVPELIFAMAPTGPGHPGPSLDGLRGQDLFELRARASKGSQVRGRSIDRFQKNSGNLYSCQSLWELGALQGGSLEFGERNEGTVNGYGSGAGTGYDAIVFASDGYLVFDKVISLQGVQEISFSHGDLVGRARFWQDGTALRVQINDQPEAVVDPTFFRNSFPLACGGYYLRFSAILPLEYGHFAGLSSDLLHDYAGGWTVDSNPPLLETNCTINEANVGTTPCQFLLKALVVEVESAVFRPDSVDPVTKDKFCEGATYTANAEVLGGEPVLEAETGRLGWRASVVNPSNEVIRTMYGFGSLGQFTIEWDGLTDAGRKAPGGIKYGIRVSAVIESIGLADRPIEVEGRVYSTAGGAGPPDADLPPYNPLQGQISPDPYIPYTDEEINGWVWSDDGYQVWPDADGDGVQEFPDHDNDGSPDFEPGQPPPGIRIFAPLVRTGVKTSWFLEAWTEDESTKLKEWAGDDNIDLEWPYEEIPKDLEPQKLKYKLTVSTCRDNNVPIEIRAQQFGGCVAASLEATQQYGAQSPQLSIRASTNPLALGIPTSSTDGAALKEAYRLFSTVHRVGVGSTFEIEASGLPGGPSAPTKVTVSVSSLNTGKALPDDVVLSETSRGSGTYVGTMSVPADLLLPQVGPKDTQQRDIQTPYVLGSISSAIYNVSTLFERYVAPRYPAERVSLGNYSTADYLSLTGTKPFPHVAGRPADGAAATVANVQTLGFETLIASLNVIDAPLTAYVKVASPARVAMLNFHGAHYDGSLGLMDDQFDQAADFYPHDLLPQYSQNLDVLFFAACNVLDINDYNNSMLNEVRSDNLPGWTPSSLRENPGLKWDKEFILKHQSSRPPGRPPQVLLGYNGPAPAQLVGEVMTEYGNQLPNFSGAANAQQMAWMTANLIVGQSDPASGSYASLCLQACAIDKDRYYYIPFEYDWENTPDPRWMGAKPESIQGIYWVERTRWGETPQEWDKNFSPVAKGGLGIAQKASRL